MQLIDVFNGDADGICALHQLRLAEPCDSILVTGIKRDINLLKKVHANQGDKITVLDISLDKNREGLEANLSSGAKVVYFDHHFSGEIPQDHNLEAYINTDANMCTSLLVNDYLKGKYLAWAVTAAYGDNLYDAAERAAEPLKLSRQKLEQLKLLGTCINYNGYGASLDDLIFAPDELYKKIKPYSDPFDFIKNESAYKKLVDGYNRDISNAKSIQPEFESDSHALFILENKSWSKRVSGVFANQLAHENPNRAHAMLTKSSEDGFLVSVRAPINHKTGADELCRKFETGGGRKAAAGINHLPNENYNAFLTEFLASFKN